MFFHEPSNAHPQALSPHGQSDGGIEGLPERLLRGVTLRAAEELRRCPGRPEGLRGRAGGESVDRHRVHQLRAL